MLKPFEPSLEDRAATIVLTDRYITEEEHVLGIGCEYLVSPITKSGENNRYQRIAGPSDLDECQGGRPGDHGHIARTFLCDNSCTASLPIDGVECHVDAGTFMALQLWVG